MNVYWAKYPNFTASEFNCKHTGTNEMTPQFMDRLQKLRTEYGFPMRITSGYRHPTHPVEANKGRPGVHTLGIAADIAVNGSQAYRLVMLAIKHGFTGIGIAQKGDSRFVHLDIAETPDWPRPTMWSY